MTDPEFLTDEANGLSNSFDYHNPRNPELAMVCRQRAARLRAIADKCRRMEEALRLLVEGCDSGNVEMNSPEIGDENGAWRWHEQWLHHARAALSEGQ
jgi:hypothetical protein